MADDGNWWVSSSTRTRYESDQSGASSSSAMASFTSSMGTELVEPNLHLMAWNQTLMREKVSLSCVEQPYDGSSSSTRYGSDDSGVYGSADQDQQSAYQNYGSNYNNYDQLWRQPLQFSNNAPFWNASAGPANDVVFSTQPPPPIFANSKPITKQMNVGEIKKSGNSTEAASKRPRNESPLPPFKVRKEKMGDRITALQQLVSPFGKTDTASVLSEAIEYIKFLHEQVTVLSTPYMKSGAPIQHHQDIVEPEEANDLRSRGLCLVPISSTFPVTHETTVDFWTPSFGGFSVLQKNIMLLVKKMTSNSKAQAIVWGSYSQRHVY